MKLGIEGPAAAITDHKLFPNIVRPCVAIYHCLEDFGTREDEEVKQMIRMLKH